MDFFFSVLIVLGIALFIFLMSLLFCFIIGCFIKTGNRSERRGKNE